MAQEFTVDRLQHLVGVFSAAVEDLISVVQGFGEVGLVIVLLVSIVISACARQIIATLAAILLSLVSWLLFRAATSPVDTLAAASALGCILVALHSLAARRRTTALNRQLNEVSNRVRQLENAEQRRLMAELRRRQTLEQAEPGPIERAEPPPEGGHAGEEAASS
jgi:hypothetical protein